MIAQTLFSFKLETTREKLTAHGGLAEVKGNGIRYVLRRNPQRSQEIGKSREDTLQSLGKDVDKHNKYLAEHVKAKVTAALREKTKRLNISNLIPVNQLRD
ncbi:MAG: hypothetical protein HQL01_00740 [Nitrospirae bacterium]|nr:hypothetical protein [Nitrospirota bacterium]